MAEKPTPVINHLVIALLLLLTSFGCRDDRDDSAMENTAALLSGTKWTTELVNDEMIIEEDYVDVDYSTTDIYFIDDSRFVEVTSYKYVSSTLGQGDGTYETGGMYSVSGNQITLKHNTKKSTLTDVWTYQKGKLKNNVYTFDKVGKIAPSEKSWAEDLWLQFAPDSIRLDFIFKYGLNNWLEPSYDKNYKLYNFVPILVFMVDKSEKMFERDISAIEAVISIDNGYTNISTKTTRRAFKVGCPKNEDAKISATPVIYLTKGVATLTLELAYYDFKKDKRIVLRTKEYKVNNLEGIISDDSGNEGDGDSNGNDNQSGNNGDSENNDAIDSENKDTKSFTVGGVTFQMKLVEGGTFQMGSTRGNNNEKPVHTVTISNDYYMGETEVTQALWKAVTGYSPTSSGSSWFSYYGVGDEYPAYYISYEDVQSFITKLNSLTGQTFRMPTEAEWEFAARGGNKSKGYEFSGSNSISDVAWYTDNSGSKTHPVKTKTANELGLYDMSGNVWEWCSDWYGSYSSNAQTDPTGPTTGLDRVIRGGGWFGSATYCRCGGRISSSRYSRSDHIGFRLALSPQ
ncbi:MAG: SUMF1/EgtB/PvdO family nonheme iron enzyme [Bacteroidales bacterium]|nr:SUMF1/EgtB/PvdO family nonheme iron enzyme [Candidatus Liminaster caballi]